MTKRRRFLTILAGAAALPAVGASASSAVSHWKGIALGARAEIILNHPDADTLIGQAVQEIRRLENIFSLYQSDSQLSQLNSTGYLSNPAFEMVELLSICDGLHARTNGAFDPTVQALWVLYAEKYAVGERPNANQISKAMTRTGWGNVEYSGSEIALSRSGMMLTLNGIAQGFIADKVTDVFRRNGVHNLLVNTGEIVALGSAPDGGTWPVTLRNHDDHVIPLQDAAIATSSPLGTTFDGENQVGHILDPRTGQPGGVWPALSVVSTSAAKADGLSTAFCIMPRDEIEAARGNSSVVFGA